MAHGHAQGMPITTNFIVTSYKPITIVTTRRLVSAYTSKDLPPLKISGGEPCNLQGMDSVMVMKVR
jgi:hypothetical protein